MTDDTQQAQHALIEQALTDPRVAAAVEAYEAVRPFVPEQGTVHLAASYAVSTTLTQLPRA